MHGHIAGALPVPSNEERSASMSVNFNALVPLDQYFERRRNVFPSPNSGQWFVRQHKDELIEAGALLRLNNRFHADENKFDEAVVEIGTKAAKRTKGAA